MSAISLKLVLHNLVGQFDDLSIPNSECELDDALQQVVGIIVCKRITRGCRTVTWV